MVNLASYVYQTARARRSRITITEQSGNSLSDYQVKITLGPGWDGWSYVSEDGSDLYFMDENDNPLYFWIESWDLANQQATIWVKVPSIPASSSVTIYMHYGGANPYASYNNASAVFDFYDDFLDLSSWRVVRTGGSGYAIAEDGYLKLKSTSSATTVDTPVTLSNIAIDAKVHVVNGGEVFSIAATLGEYRTDGQPNDAYRGGWNGWAGSPNRQRIVKHIGGTGTDLAATSEGLLANGETYLLTFIFRSPDLKMANDGAVILTASDTTFTEFSYLALYAWATSEYWIDWVRVRKYVEPEPGISIAPSVPLMKSLDLM